MLNLCTYFDSYYLHRGIALYQSLVRHSEEPFTLWILCFDQSTYDILAELNFPHVRLIHWEDFEEGDKGLQEAKTNRSRVEYYWTCTPSLPLYIFQKYSHVQQMVYIDADFYFFNSPGTIGEVADHGSILIIPHDYSPEYAAHAHSGKYNVGVMMFRADKDGLSCLKWWRDRCIEWCYWRHEEGKIGDQAYLNDWPERFQRVVVSGHAGLNAAPWNISKYELSLGQEGRLLIDGQPLVCYHFHSCHFCTSRFAFLTGHQVRLSCISISSIYRPYLRDLLEIERGLSCRGFKISMPRSGMPWRYILGLIAKRRSIRNFMWVR